MSFSIAIKFVAACALLTSAMPVFPHVVLQERTATALSLYKAALLVGHGCDGSATNQIRVTIPAGLQRVKPMPKPGWNLSIKKDKLATPYDNGHGVMVTEGVTEIAWVAASKDKVLPDAHYDEFVLRGRLPKEAGPMWFKVFQGCEKGSTDWAEIHAS
ncbi:MAG: YcnI family protein, partial [Polaromonas sp.]|uniref:YcnI family protein n=1 Tax=Polaromonas sp. TaxID=1869339 RepID=UPI00180A442F